jgi:nicotinamidase-related amidase
MQTVRISKNRAVLLLCDIQEKFMPTVYAHKAVQEAIVLSLKIANAFDLPVIATEHNPTVYGKMIPELTSFLPEKHHLSEKVYPLRNSEPTP